MTGVATLPSIDLTEKWIMELFKTIICSLLLLPLMSCERINPCLNFAELDPSVRMLGEAKLRLDGYYFYTPTDSSQIPKGTIRYYVLYGNGVAYTGTEKGLEEIESRLETAPNLVISYEHRDDWGMFGTTGDSIAVENWVPAQCGKPSILAMGRVIDDTTFLLTRSYRKDIHSRVTDSSFSSATYHFRPFHPKPDSTNEFVP